MPENAAINRCITPNTYALNVSASSIHKILKFIELGQLRAVNVSLCSRPQWKITPEAIAAFEQGRAPQPQQAITRRTCRNGDYKRFF